MFIKFKRDNLLIPLKDFFILKEYFLTKLKFLKNNQGENELNKINDNNVQKYLINLDQNFININDYVYSTDVCQTCFKGEMIPVEHEGIMVCNNCSNHMTYLIENEKPSYKEPPKEACFYAYKRIRSCWMGISKKAKIRGI